MHGIVDADSSSRLIELAVLLENVAFDRMDASPDLIYAMIDTLRVLNEAHSHTQADVHFSAQLLVSALVASSQRLSVRPKLIAKPSPLTSLPSGAARWRQAASGTGHGLHAKCAR